MGFSVFYSMSIIQDVLELFTKTKLKQLCFNLPFDDYLHNKKDEVIIASSYGICQKYPLKPKLI